MRGQECKSRNAVAGASASNSLRTSITTAATPLAITRIAGDADAIGGASKSFSPASNTPTSWSPNGTENRTHAQPWLTSLSDDEFTTCTHCGNDIPIADARECECGIGGLVCFDFPYCMRNAKEMA